MAENSLWPRLLKHWEAQRSRWTLKKLGVCGWGRTILIIGTHGARPKSRYWFFFFSFKPEFHKSPKTYNLLSSPLAVTPFPIHPEPVAVCCVIRECRSHASSVGHQYLAPKTEPSTH